MKAALAHRFHRLYVLHHCTLTWAYETRRARDDRRQQHEDEQRKARIAGFLSRITHPEPQSHTGCDSSSDQSVLNKPSAQPSPSPIRTKPRSGPNLATAARADAKRRNLLEHASIHQQVSPIISDSLDKADGASAAPVLDKGQVCTAGTAGVGCYDWQPGQTYQLIKRMKQQLKDRHLPGGSSLTLRGGDEASSHTDDQDRSMNPQPTSTQPNGGEAYIELPSNIESTISLQPAFGNLQQPLARNTHRIKTPQKAPIAAVLPAGSSARNPESKSTDTSLSRRRTTGSSNQIPSSRSSPAPRRGTTGNLPSSPSSCTGAAVGIKRPSSTKPPSKVEASWGTGNLGDGDEALAKAKNSEALQRRKTAVRDAVNGTN